MNREELKKIIRGAIVTMPTPFDDDFNVDIPRMSEITKWWVDQGLGTSKAPLKVAAAMGEGPDLSDDEWPHLLRAVVNAAPGKNVICAIQVKNTLATIEDAKKAQDLGAVGLQIDLPFLHHSNQDDLVRFFSDISEQIDIGIMIYNTHWFCQNPVAEYLNADTMLRLKDAEHVTAIKWSVPEGEDYDSMTKCSGEFNVIDNSGQHVRCFKNGGAGYISSLIPVYPAYDLELLDLLENGKYEEAQAKEDIVNDAFSEWNKKTHAKSGGYRQGKGLMAALGRPVGPPRPPTLPCDEKEIAEAKPILEKLGWS